MARVRSWRVTNRKYVDTAFSGEGARLHGGRFNSVGVPVVYCSGSLSLALLEILAQANQRRRIGEHVCIPLSFREDDIEVAENLPEGWDARPPRLDAQMYGDFWAKQRRSLVLRVPSVIVPVEFNFLINPAHTAFDSIVTGEPRPLPFDRRLISDDI